MAGTGRHPQTCRNLEGPVRHLGCTAKTSALKDSRQHTEGYAVEASLPLISALEERLQTHFQSFPLPFWRDINKESQNTMFWIALPRSNFCRQITASSASSSSCQNITNIHTIINYSFGDWDVYRLSIKMSKSLTHIQPFVPCFWTSFF